MDGQEMTLVAEAFASNWIAPLGPFVNRFESELGTYLDGYGACVLSSGTSAIHLALLALGVAQGDRVYCSDFTFAATANAIRYCGADPVFIDADRESWQMDTGLLEALLEKDAQRGQLPKAILIVDLYGIPANYEVIEALCARFDVPLVEDAAEALGSRYKGKKCGCFGRVAILSFNGNKVITTSGGGALISNDPKIVAHARYLATQARQPLPYYQHTDIGYNYRLSNLLAAVGCAQLAVIEDRVDRRRAVNAEYKRALADIDGVSFMPEPTDARSNCWLTVIQLDPKIIKQTPDEIRLKLENENIETRHAWKPMHMQPVFEEFEASLNGVSEEVFARGLCLPSGSNLTQADQDRVCTMLRAALAAD